jgi:hypothetical protein
VRPDLPSLLRLADRGRAVAHTPRGRKGAREREARGARRRSAQVAREVHVQACCGHYRSGGRSGDRSRGRRFCVGGGCCTCGLGIPSSFFVGFSLCMGPYMTPQKYIQYIMSFFFTVPCAWQQTQSRMYSGNDISFIHLTQGAPLGRELSQHYDLFPFRCFESFATANNYIRLSYEHQRYGSTRKKKERLCDLDVPRRQASKTKETRAY